MNRGINQRVRWTARFAPPAIQASNFGKNSFLSNRKVLLSLAALAAAAVQLAAQQPYGYGAYGAYSSQYPVPASQYNYAQPQYQQPQYAQPQYAQPQYSQPQYAQPQYQQPQYAQQPAPAPQQAYGDQGAPDLAEPQSAPAQQPLSAGDLEQLLAPIALYPDNLLAQILAASTYPAQVAAADQWANNMRAQGYGSPDQIAAGAQAQGGWDPSVKALTAFPQVLDMMNQNLEWTTALGNAYYNQPQDVMQTVQVLRQRAEQAGNLQTTPQQDVTDNQGYIDVAPANPEVVYVPAYNPWYAYGAPLAPYPGFSFVGALGSFFGVGIRFGGGIAMAAFERMPFGWMGWGLSWLTHSIFFNHSPYFTHSTTVADWGFPHGGQRVFGYREGGHGLPGNGYHTPLPMNHYGNGYGSARGYGYTHPEPPRQLENNHIPQPQAYASRPQNYARPAYNYGDTYRPPVQNYGSRPGMAYTSPYQGYRTPTYREPAYRAPEVSASRGYSTRGNEAYGDFARNEHSGGFHPFGSGHGSGGFESRAPKSFGGGHAPKSFGHEKAPKESHSGGHGHWH